MEATPAIVDTTPFLPGLSPAHAEPSQRSREHHGQHNPAIAHFARRKTRRAATYVWLRQRWSVCLRKRPLRRLGHKVRAGRPGAIASACTGLLGPALLVRIAVLRTFADRAGLAIGGSIRIRRPHLSAMGTQAGRSIESRLGDAGDRPNEADHLASDGGCDHDLWVTASIKGPTENLP